MALAFTTEDILRFKKSADKIIARARAAAADKSDPETTAASFLLSLEEDRKREQERKRQDYLSAFHESGHFITALGVGLEIPKHLSIEKNPHCLLTYRPPRSRRDLEGLVSTSIAGCVAEMLAGLLLENSSGNEEKKKALILSLVASSDDYAKVAGDRKLYMVLCPDDEDWEELLFLAHLRTLNFLNKNWETVSRLANALLLTRNLNGSEAAAIGFPAFAYRYTR